MGSAANEGRSMDLISILAMSLSAEQSSWPLSALLETRCRKTDEIVASTPTSVTFNSEQLIQTKYENPKT
jgi:hypothetical protein